MDLGARASICPLIPCLTASRRDSFPKMAPHFFLIPEHSLSEAILMTSLFLPPQVPLMYLLFPYIKLQPSVSESVEGEMCASSGWETHPSSVPP